ncbi:MAG: TonB family protein [Taibaiella sp.]|nr:TonB family protein [Taibaiella sp.]
MKSLLIGLLLCCCAQVYSQDTLFYNGNEVVGSKEYCTYFEVTQAKQKKDAYVARSYYKNGRKRSVLPYFVDEKGTRIRDGKKIQWFETGRKKQLVHFKNNQLHGKVKSYYAKGRLKRRDVYRNGNLVKGQCWDERGQKIAHRPYFVIAQYTGGDAARQRFLSDNLRYPNIARENEIQGKVKLSFAIEKDGSITAVKIDESVHESLDREAQRVILKMPRWQPATEDDEPVKSYFALPIQFRLK